MTEFLNWFWLALYFAIWSSIGTAVLKHLTKTINPLAIIVVSNIITLPFMLLIINYLGGFPQVTSKFFIFMTTSGILDTIATISLFFAITFSEISLISPISAFNPVFITIISALTIKEAPSLIQILGIVLIAFGAYLLNISDIRGGLLSPYKKLFSNRGVQLFLLTNFLWAITPILQKRSMLEINPPMPFFPSFFGWTFVTLAVLPIALIKINNIKTQVTRIKSNWYWFLFIAPFGALAAWAAFTAFSLQNLGPVSAIFKLSVLFTIIWGFIFFKEHRIWERFLGGAIMILGTILLVR